MLTLVIYSILLVSCHSISIGTLNQTRFTSVDRLNSDAVWINNQPSPKYCLCTVLSQYTDVLLFNSYKNGSCQLFFSLPYTYTMEHNVNSTIIFLSQIPPYNQASCCSNVMWLIARIGNSTIPSLAMVSPIYMVIDDLDYLVVISGNNFLFHYNRTTMQLNTAKSILSAQAISYYNKQYFITQGSGLSSQLTVYSMDDLALITSIPIPYDPSDYVCIENGTIMVVAIRSNHTIGFYNVTSPTSYVPMFNLSAPSQPHSLYRANDTLIYMATNLTSDPVYTLKYDVVTSSWNWSYLPLTRSNSTTSNFQSTIDACGQLLVSVNGYGIRTFDTYGTKSIYNWSRSNHYGSLAMSKHFDLYIGDWYTSQIISYQSGIEQCTS